CTPCFDKNTSRHRFFNWRHENLLGRIAHARNHSELKLRTKHCCLGQEAVTLCRKPGKAAADDVSNALGYTPFRYRLYVSYPKPVLSAQAPGLHQMPNHFLNKEGIALGLAVYHPCQFIFAKLLLGKSFDEGPDLAFVETSQQNTLKKSSPA